MLHFRPCSGCDRHVRSDEIRCPFCDRELPAADRPPPAPSARLGRAALMAFGTAVAAASLAGCKGDAPAVEAEAEENTPVARPDTETRSAPAEDEKRRQGSAEKADSAPIQSPFLVGSEPPNPTPLTGNPPDTGRPPVIQQTAQTVKRPPPPPPPPPDWRHRNKAMPYGAPPADGLLEIV